jgi:ABC-type oligopeptide transport system ATPase subunit
MNFKNWTEKILKKPEQPITSNEIDAVIKILPAKKTGFDEFTAEFYQVIKEVLTPMI